MTRYTFELAAARMRTKRRKKPGSGALGKIEKTTEEEIKRRFEPPVTNKRPMPIHPSVEFATADELIAAGYGSIPRWQIPPDWRAHKEAMNLKEKLQRSDQQVLCDFLESLRFDCIKLYGLADGSVEIWRSDRKISTLDLSVVKR